jgi:hypothetical protein
MGAILSLLPFIGNILDKVIPDPQAKADAQLKVMELAQNGELAILKSQTDLATGQLEVNKAEAINSSLFVAGWRPFIGWVCGAALTYHYLVRPLAIWVCLFYGITIPELPGLDDNLWQLLAGMLGLGGLRTYEKVKGATK